jgi:hypothetical protein
MIVMCLCIYVDTINKQRVCYIIQVKRERIWRFTVDMKGKKIQEA